ncbi:hypothetical protein ILYODFUR_005830 [Ilyodon furcidens]|uniref:Uncharacterized protein n=1 Tax=Ilyodon furcidens TaxID=33524 RepID=A0ABV0SIR8_9TELE
MSFDFQLCQKVCGMSATALRCFEMPHMLQELPNNNVTSLHIYLTFLDVQLNSTIIYWSIIFRKILFRITFSSPFDETLNSALLFPVFASKSLKFVLLDKQLLNRSL